MAKLTSNIDYVQYALNIAYDDRYYYAHSGDKFAFSCSTLVGHALYECGYVTKDPKPKDGHAIGGSVLDSYLKEAGFVRYAWAKAGGLQPGDALIVQPYHIGFYVADGMMVAANGGGDMVDKRPEAITVYKYTAYGTPQYVWRRPSTKTEKAITQMIKWANDNSHGYDQAYRWGQKGDYDCSAAVIQAWQNAGVPVKTAGASYTGNMRSVFLSNGFTDITSKVNIPTGSGLQRGDVLLNTKHHVAMFCGNGDEVEASINESGGITGGKPGDQTGKEFLIRSYRNYPWDCILRYKDSASTGTQSSTETRKEEVYMFEFNRIEYGASGKDVKIFQAALKGRGYIDRQTKKAITVDGNWGDATQRAFAYFQEKNNLSVKKYCDQARWKKLLWR